MEGTRVFTCTRDWSQASHCMLPDTCLYQTSEFQVFYSAFHSIYYTRLVFCNMLVCNMSWYRFDSYLLFFEGVGGWKMHVFLLVLLFLSCEISSGHQARKHHFKGLFVMRTIFVRRFAKVSLLIVLQPFLLSIVKLAALVVC